MAHTASHRTLRGIAVALTALATSVPAVAQVPGGTQSPADAPASADVQASASAPAPGLQLMPNYRDADLRQIVEAVGEVSGRNFLVDPRVTGQVTFLSASPMSPEAFYEAFLATLAMHGFVAMEAGEVIKILPDANARVHPAVAEGDGGERIVTRVLQLENVGAAQLVPLLRPLMPQYAHLAAHPGSNSLIAADRASNVNRLVSIIGRMDKATESQFEVVRLENASAADVVSMLSILNRADAAEGLPPLQVAADNRTNTLLLHGPLNRRLRYRALIAHLDTPSEAGGDTRVRYLNYADAETLASNLQAQFAGSGTGDPEPINLWADPGTNSLIVNAPARILQDLNAVIDKLDIPRAQVQVDAIIVELTQNRANELGVTWALQGAYENRPVAGTNFPASAPGIFQLGPAAANGDASATSSLPEGIVTGLGRIGDAGTSWAAVLTALAGDASTNIIATPTIVTLDNEQAQIEVGSEVPFLTGQYSGSGTTAGAINPFQTIDRTPVGTRLMITPQINEGSGVKLVIEQETSSISQGVQGAVDLVTDRRSIRTSVFVEDGRILVLGGLIDDQLREIEQRVPLMGRIPLVGALFRSRSTELKKTNLMVFIRPTILRDSAQATFQTDAKYRYIRDLQLQQGEAGVPLMQGEARPTLPALESASAREGAAARSSASDLDGDAASGDDSAPESNLPGDRTVP